LARANDERSDYSGPKKNCDPQERIVGGGSTVLDECKGTLTSLSLRRWAAEPASLVCTRPECVWTWRGGGGDVQLGSNGSAGLRAVGGALIGRLRTRRRDSHGRSQRARIVHDHAFNSQVGNSATRILQLRSGTPRLMDPSPDPRLGQFR
jgi:hypothetical protein